MDIKGYLLGSPPFVGATFSVPTTSVGPRLWPLAPSSLPTTCGDNFLGAHHLCWAKACFPHSQLAPLTPSSLPLAPLAPSPLPACSPCSQWPRKARSMLYYVLDPHHLCAGKGIGSKREWAESEREQAGSEREWGEQEGASLSKPNVMLCLRVPTTSVGARSEGSPQLSYLTPSSLPSFPHPWASLDP